MITYFLVMNSKRCSYTILFIQSDPFNERHGYHWGPRKLRINNNQVKQK